MSNVSRILFVGKPGAGKSNHSKYLSEATGIPHFGLGPLFLEEIEKNTNLGNEIKKYMDSQRIIPDIYCNPLMKKFVITHEQFILDGYPRNINQAEYLDNLTYYTPIDFVFNLTVPDEEAVRRLLKRNREDARNENEALKRLQEDSLIRDVYLNYYSKKGILITIDTLKDKETVKMEIYKNITS